MSHEDQSTSAGARSRAGPSTWALERIASRFSARSVGTPGHRCKENPMLFREFNEFREVVLRGNPNVMIFEGDSFNYFVDRLAGRRIESHTPFSQCPASRD